MSKSVKISVFLTVSLIQSLSVVLCQEKDYADVNCQYDYGGIVCDCANSKYVNTIRLCSVQ